jgi:hypothetical protein
MGTDTIIEEIHETRKRLVKEAQFDLEIYLSGVIQRQNESETNQTSIVLKKQPSLADQTLGS